MPADILGTRSSHDTQCRRQGASRSGISANIVLATRIQPPAATPEDARARPRGHAGASRLRRKRTHVLDEPFVVLATQNPLEMEGTYPLPEAQLDRFFLQAHVPFPNREELHAILDLTTGGRAYRAHRPSSTARTSCACRTSFAVSRSHATSRTTRNPRRPGHASPTARTRRRSASASSAGASPARAHRAPRPGKESRRSSRGRLRREHRRRSAAVAARRRSVHRVPSTSRARARAMKTDFRSSKRIIKALPEQGRGKAEAQVGLS